MERTYICSIPIDPLTMSETLGRIDNAIHCKLSLHHVAINAAKVVKAQKDKLLKDSITCCDIINADGQAVIWASRLLKKTLPERVAGIDLMIALVKLASDKKYKIFFLGAEEKVVSSVVDIYKTKYGESIIAGFRNGYFSKDEESLIIEAINMSEADILFVALGSPQKEIFLKTYRTQLKTSFVMGVGGSFDVIAGRVKRAPIWMQNSGLEWFYRVIQEPRRMWKRYLFSNISFIYLVLKQKANELWKL